MSTATCQPCLYKLRLVNNSATLSFLLTVLGNEQFFPSVSTEIQLIFRATELRRCLLQYSSEQTRGIRSTAQADPCAHEETQL